MTIIPNARSQPAGSRLAIGLLETYLACLSALMRSLRRRRDRAYLDELPDHLLCDIGIYRFEIGSAVRFGRRPAPQSSERDGQ
jgi:uncharacterized protein YjiS (DUF1127 family)